jgi:HEAT repeat protein
MDQQLLGRAIKALGSRSDNRRQRAAYFRSSRASRIRVSDLDIAALGPALAKALDDRDVEVRRMVAETLEQLGEKALPARDALCRAVRDKDREVSEHAVGALREAGSEGIQAILDIYKRSGPALRRKVVTGLGLSQGAIEGLRPEIIQAAARTLMAALSSRDVKLRRAGAGGFRWYGRYAQPAVPMLVDAIEDTDPEVRAGAVDSLAFLPAEIGGTMEPAMRLFRDTDASVRQAVIGTLGFFGKRARAAAPAMVGLLVDEDEDVRREARQTLGWIGPAAVPELAAKLKSNNVRMRRAVAEPLSEFYKYCPAAVVALMEALRDPDVEVRRNAASAFGMYGRQAKPALPLLIQALKDVDADVRSSAAHVLGNLGPDAVTAIPTLIKTLEDQEAKVRRYAVSALATLAGQDARMVPHFVKALTDQDDDVQTEALAALQALGTKAKPAEPALVEMLTQESLWLKVRLTLARIGHDMTSIMPEFIRELQSKDPSGQLIETLGEMGPAAKPAEAALLQLLKEGPKAVSRISDPWKRASQLRLVEVAKALWQIGKRTDLVLPFLTSLLRDGALGVDEGVCDVFHLIGPDGKDAVPALVEALQREDSWDPQWAASDALCAIGPEAKAAVPALVSALRSPASAQWATKVLAKIGPSAVPALIKGLRSANAQTREWAADALGQIGGQAAPATRDLKRLLNDEKQAVRWWAAIALAHIRPMPVVLSHLIEAIQADDDSVRAGAAQALGGMGASARSAAKFLKAALEDGDRHVRECASEALRLVGRSR